MGTRWGINRTVAQIHALLYISPEPLNAEEISATLSVARSTVSTGLRELQSWGIVSVVHVLGDRRDHFIAMEDVWGMFRIVLEGLRGEDTIAELCRREGISSNLYYNWSKEFLEAGKRRLMGNTKRQADSTEVTDLRRQNNDLKHLVADLSLENVQLKKTYDDLDKGSDER